MSKFTHKGLDGQENLPSNYVLKQVFDLVFFFLRFLSYSYKYLIKLIEIKKTKK